MGPNTTPSLISKGGGIRYPPLTWNEIDTPLEIGLKEKVKMGEQNWTNLD